MFVDWSGGRGRMRVLMAFGAAWAGCGGGGGGTTVPDDAGGPGVYSGPCQLPPGLPITVPELDVSSEYVFSAEHLLLYEITVSDEEWQKVCQVGRDKAQAEKDDNDAFEYTYADASLRVFDESFPHVGLRFRGDISVETLFFPAVGDDGDPEPEYQECLQYRFLRKPNFKIGVTENAGPKFHEQKHLSFGGREGGASMMKDYVIAGLSRDFAVPAPRVTHALLCINDIYRGVITVQEEHDDQAFLDHHFPHSPDGTYYKVHDNGPQAFHTATDLTDYRASYDPSAGTDQAAFTLETDLLVFLQWVNFTEPAQFAAEAASWLDVDAWLKISALETVLPDWDGLFSGQHNYLLYHDPEFGWWPVRNDWDHGLEPQLVDEPASGSRLFDLPLVGADLADHTNLCDGRAPRDAGETSCPGGCTYDKITHAVVPARLMYAERARYLDHVQTLLEDVFIPTTVKQRIEERRTQLDVYYDAPQGDDEPWLTYDEWTEGVDLLLADVDLAHQDATAALQDARNNPPGAAPMSQWGTMLMQCGETSCWPYACP